MKVLLSKQVYALSLATLLTIGLLPSAASAAENESKIDEGVTISAPEGIHFNAEREAQVKLFLKGDQDKVKAIVDDDQLEAILPQGLTLVNKDLKWQLDGDQGYVCTLQVKADESAIMSDDVAVPGQPADLIVKVNEAAGGKELFSQDVKVARLDASSDYTVQGHYLLDYRKDGVRLNLELVVKGATAALPEAVSLEHAIPVGAELVASSISDEGVYQPVDGAITWTLQAKPGEQERKLHYQVKLKPGYDVSLLAKWDRQVKLKLAGSWVDVALDKELTGTPALLEKVAIQDEGAEVAENQILQKYIIQNETDTDLLLNLVFHGLLPGGGKVYLDLDHNGKITDVDRLVTDKLPVKAKGSADIIAVDNISQPAAGTATLGLTATVEGDQAASYTSENTVNLATGQGTATPSGSGQTSGATAGGAGNVPVSGSVNGSVNGTPSGTANGQTSGTTTNGSANAPTNGTANGSANVPANGAVSGSGANTSSTPAAPAGRSANSSSRYGLTKLPKTGSDVPKYLWYLFGAMLVGVGSILQWKRSKEQ